MARKFSVSKFKLVLKKMKNIAIIKMFFPLMVPENLFYSSAVKLKLNEAISLNLRGQLQIPFTEFL